MADPDEFVIVVRGLFFSDRAQHYCWTADPKAAARFPSRERAEAVLAYWANPCAPKARAPGALRTYRGGVDCTDTGIVACAAQL